jgi:hypothetical protein
MRAAVEAVVARKFGPRGPFNPATPGPFKDTAAVRGAAAPMDERFVDCVVTMAEYVHATFGRFPATVPPIFALMYLQAHQLDTEFYDAHFARGPTCAPTPSTRGTGPEARRGRTRPRGPAR